MAIDDVEKRAPLSLSTVAVKDFDSLSNSNSGSIDGTEKKDSVNVSSQYLHDREAIIDRIRSSDDMDDIFAEDIEFIIDRLQHIESPESYEVLVEAMDYFGTDINFPAKTLQKIEKLLTGEEAYGLGPAMYDLDLRLEACLIKYHSPYPEVRSVCKLSQREVILVLLMVCGSR
ncbi:hypothetical protein V1506DRAFT_546143 [Lipomyces tetrasporus]